MKATAFLLGTIFLTQVCCQVTTGPVPAPTDSPGLLQTLLESAREKGDRVRGFGKSVMGYFNAYYEDHIQPVTDSYKHWASNISSSMWERTQATIANYMPFTNGTLI